MRDYTVLTLYDIYDDGHRSKPYTKFSFAIEQRKKMIPIRSLCDKCGEFVNVIDIVDEKQINREEKINQLINT